MTKQDLRYDTISFISDFGHADEFVGVVHSVIRSINPEVQVVDVTHGVTPFDIRGAGLALARTVEYLCPGVVLAVVDPGVGTDRKAVAVEVGDGASVLVGPDNGLLAPAVALVGGASRAFELTNVDYQLPRVGSTFEGRDIFAPAAAHLAMGVPLESFGPEIDPALLMPGILPTLAVEGGVITCESLWIDGYGNVQLNLGPDDLRIVGDPFILSVGDHREVISLKPSYSEVGAGEVGAIIDSSGLVSLSIRGGSAANTLGIGPAVELKIEPADLGVAIKSTSTPVQLGDRPDEGERL